MEPQTHDHLSEEEKSQKIQSLREMISNAEKTIQGAKAMLLQFEGKKRVGRKRKLEDEDGEIVQGIFDGQIMLGNNGKQYPVPPNYASKSKLIEGDLLKLTITDTGSFIYKQIGPIERKHLLGIVAQDESGGYFVISHNKPYKVLLASITYFQAEPGDEVAIVCPMDIESNWASIENIVQKAKFSSTDPMVKITDDQKAQAIVTNTTSSLLEEAPTEETSNSLQKESASFSQVDSHLDTAKDLEEKTTPDTSEIHSPFPQETTPNVSATDDSRQTPSTKDALLDITDFDIDDEESPTEDTSSKKDIAPQKDSQTQSAQDGSTSTPLLETHPPKLLEESEGINTSSLQETEENTNTPDGEEETLNLLNEWQADIEEIEKEMAKDTEQTTQPAQNRQ